MMDEVFLESNLRKSSDLRSNPRALEASPLLGTQNSGPLRPFFLSRLKMRDIVSVTSLSSILSTIWRDGVLIQKMKTKFEISNKKGNACRQDTLKDTFGSKFTRQAYGKK